MMKLARMMKNRKGFTLVELMVVVIIIGVLVAIAVPLYNNTMTNSKTKACQANIRIIEGAIEQAVANGVARTSINNATLYTASSTNNYVKEWPICPFSDGTKFLYTVSSGSLNVTDHLNAATTSAGVTHKE